MKMKIIDILNKIANGEQPPKKIKYKDDVCIWQNNWYYYDTDTIILDQMQFDVTGLNEEVEILETTITYNQDDYVQYQPYTGEVEIKCNSPKNILESDKIEKIDIINDKMIAFDDKYQDIYIGGCTPTQIAFAIKINEIIDYINKE